MTTDTTLVPVNEEIYPGWVRIKCHNCRGYGVVDTYTDGPDDCSTCDGGFLFKHTKSGVIALYPGGPFV